MPNRNLGTIRGTIEIDYDGAGIVKAVKDTKSAKTEMGGLEKAADKVIGVFSNVVKVGAKVGATCLGISGGIHLIAAALAIVGPLVGAGLATLPGVIAAAGTAMVVMKVALMGVSQAFKDAGADQKTFNKDLKGLAPSAQAFAKAYRALIPVLKPVQKAIQQSFFKGLAPSLTAAGKSLVGFKTGASGVAGAMGGVVKQILQFARSQQFVNMVNVSLNTVKGILHAITPEVQPILKAFAGLAGQSDQLGKNVAGPLAGALKTFAGFISRINLTQLWGNALPILHTLATAFSTIGGIVGPIFKTLTSGGSNAAGILGALAQTLAKFLASAQGQSALAAIGKAFNAISTGAGQVFLALLQALAPALIALLPGVTVLANMITANLVPAIVKLTPALTAVAAWVSRNIKWLGPLALAVYTLAVAYKAYIGVMKIWAGIQKVATVLKLKDLAAWIALRAQIVATKIQEMSYIAYMKGQAAAAWAINTARMLANKAATLGVALAQKAQAIPGLIASTAATVANTAVTAANAAVRAGAFLASWVATTAAMVAQRIAMIAYLVWTNAIKVATVAWAAVQWALNAALDANPIGLVVIAVAALVAGIILLWKNSATFRTIVLAVWGAIKVAVKATVDWIVHTAVPWIIKAWDFMWNGAKFLWSMIVFYFNLVKSVVNMVIGWITSFIRREIAGWENIFHGIGRVVGIVENAFKGAYNKAKSWVGNLITMVKGIPGKVTAALGNLGSLLYQKGRSLVQGFIDGIGSMIAKAEQKAKDLVHSVTKWLPGSPAEVGPLSGKGYVYLRGQRFVKDLARGMAKMRKLPTAAVRGIVRPVATSVPSAGSGARSGPSTADTPTPGGPNMYGPYHLMLDKGVITSFFIDAITGQPQIINSTSREGSRQNAWAGSGRTS